MTISKTVLALGFGALVSVSGGAKAAVAVSASAVAAPGPQPAANITLVADGCGIGWYRGPGGACHVFGRGPYPGGYWGGGYAPYPAYSGYNAWNGCPLGYWRGPWGHCRNTPYHGRLPGGGWQ